MLGEENIQIENPLDNVICYVCKKPLDRRDENCVHLENGKYAHKECHEYKINNLTDEEKLYIYIMHLFKTDYVHQKVRKQINDFMKEYNYSYSGIQKTLFYWHEVKKNPIEKAKGGIGIVPYVYNDAYNYFRAIWEANERNKEKTISFYKPKEIVIKIPPLRKKTKKRKLFTFLDEGVNNG